MSIHLHLHANGIFVCCFVEVFGHIESVEILVILNPTEPVTCSHLPVWLYSFEVYSSINYSKMTGNSLEVSNFNRLFSNSIGSSITNR